MDKPVLEKDTDLLFPHFTILKASAGSGKTYALSNRFVQYLLSERIPKNRLRNIVAMTFSNNAAKEMRERILLWLKLLSLGDEKTLARFAGLLSLPAEDLQNKAGCLLDEILEQYADFQVRTIDSFMTTIFKASALDFGYHPEFDILLDNALTMEYAFHRFLRRVAEGTGDAAMIEAMVGRIMGQKRSEAAYLWDPSSNLLEEMKQLSRVTASRGKQLVIPDAADNLRICESKIRECIEAIEKVIRDSGLEVSGNSAYTKSDIPALARDGRFSDLVGKKLAAKPVNKPKKKDLRLVDAYEATQKAWGNLGELVHEYTLLYALSFYRPYLSVLEAFGQTIEDVKRKQSVIFIEDINRCLASYLDLNIVPDIYFRLGETINHFFIDEFQDTSPIQWKNLYPLLENALAEHGSVFVVGDTKQAIYGFRDADYKIMKDAENKNPFPSASYTVRELETNYRSCPEILSYNECVFKKDLAANEDYQVAARESGLNEYVQQADPNCAIPGHVELHCVIKGDDEHAEKEKLVEIIQSLKMRQYRYSDIAILTQRNEEAVRITSWLNDKNIPFLSFSSLDIRLRKLTGEMVALLRFLDSPTDDFSFANFLLGDVFSRTLAAADSAGKRPDFHAFLFFVRQRGTLYKAFQDSYPDLWERYFSRLFRSSGYFPLYDLVTQAYHAFRLFDIFAEEEATLIKLLETVKDFEGQGFNSLGDFLDFAESEEAAAAEWHMNVPTTQDAVRVMTIHKAKGLGFPVAVVMLFEHRPQGFGYVVKDDKDVFSILKITKDMAQLDEGLGELYEAAAQKEIVNSLNSLYVGFTRPEEELYVIGVTGKLEQPGYPLSLLPFSAYQSCYRPERRAPEEAGVRNDVQLLHRHAEIVFPSAVEGVLNITEKRRGDLIHAILAGIQYMDEGPESAIEQAIQKLSTLYTMEYPLDAVCKTLASFLSHSEVAAYFFQKPDRKVWNEQELVDEGGRLFRIDRLVVDPKETTVIDYKTGGQEDAEEYHLPQMRNYLHIVRGIYSDRSVSGIIAYVDQQKLRRIS
jgi:ATP-dependent exoDNAse (exonuclease V) beta subunit